MINSVTSGIPIGDQPDRQSSHGNPDKEGKDRPPAPKAPSDSPLQHKPNLRLMVDADPAKGGLVYKLVNRETGEVVSQISRDDLAALNEDPNYSAGAWLDTKA